MNKQFEYDRLREHVGHRLSCVMYGDGVNVSVECEDCSCVLVDVDKPRSDVVLVKTTPAEQARMFLDGNMEMHTQFLDWAVERWGVTRSDAKREVSRFIMYWTEPTKSGRKVRWELEKVFDVKRRLVTWFSRSDAVRKVGSAPDIKVHKL
jgi:hypothetical protein